MTPRPWYHRAEWIGLLVVMAGSIIGGATAIARNDAQTLQNTKDIGALQGKVDSIPERLGRIEQALIDLKALEKQRGTARADP